MVNSCIHLFIYIFLSIFLTVVVTQDCKFLTIVVTQPRLKMYTFCGYSTLFIPYLLNLGGQCELPCPGGCTDGRQPWLMLVEMVDHNYNQGRFPAVNAASTAFMRGEEVNERCFGKAENNLRLPFADHSSATLSIHNYLCTSEVSILV